MTLPPPPPPLPEETMASTVTPAATTGTHIFKIEGYNMIKSSHGTGTRVESPKFQAAGHTWTISLYPNGSTKKNLGLSLHDDDAAVGDAVVQATVCFSFCSADSADSTTASSYPMSFYVGSMHCCTILSNWDMLWSYIEDDSLTIRCDITVVEKTAVNLGIICNCNDDLCKRHHVATTSGNEDHNKKAASSKPRLFGCFRYN
uniref:MATH domain-containing protein n=1 Tax=Leersia perrieri TaxID=77586 RepID=A0A0D9XUE4_9ORYZ